MSNNLDNLIDAIATRDNDPAYSIALTGHTTKKLRNKIDSLRKRIALMRSTRTLVELCQRLKLTPSFLHRDASAYDFLSTYKKDHVQNAVDSICTLYISHLNKEMSRNEVALTTILPAGWLTPDSSSLTPQINEREDRNLETHISALAQELANTHLAKNPSNGPQRVLTFVCRPLFWSDWLHWRTNSICMECHDIIHTDDPVTAPPMVTSLLERVVDYEGKYTIRQLGTNLHMIDHAGLHTPVDMGLIETLSLGLNYVPPSTAYPCDKLTTCFQDFIHKLKWRYFWNHRQCLSALNTPNNKILDILPLKLRSRLAPTKAPANSKLETFATSTHLALHQLLSVPRTPNTEDSLIIKRVDHLKHFFSTQGPTGLILKPADKGGATVILHHDFYKAKMLQLLDESKTFFQVIPLDPIPALLVRIQDALTHLKKIGILNNRTFNMIKPDAKSRCPSLYGLPKIHKVLVSFRPIISGNGHPTEAISILIDYLLQPYSTRNPFYLKDSTQLLNILTGLATLRQAAIPIKQPEVIDDTTLLFNLDVIGMYTNIPLTEAETSATDCVNEDTSLLIRGKNTRFNKRLVAALLHLTLFNNYFRFNNVFYHQTHGIAMGTPCACTVSDIFICRFMDKALQNAPLKPTIYKQYRDDGFGVWTHGPAALESFRDYLNSLHPTIKFTLNFGRTIDYLDLRLTLDKYGHIQSETFYKETETFEYLHPLSNHPPHCKQNIALSQQIRHIRNCSTRSSFRHHTLLLKHNLVKRGYKKMLVNRKMRAHSFMDRPQLLKYKRRAPMLRTPLILPYDHCIPNVNTLVAANLTASSMTPDDITLIGGQPLIGHIIEDAIRSGIVKAQFPAKIRHLRRPSSSQK